MRVLSLAVGALAALASVASVAADPIGGLAADDPTYRSSWRPPPSPVAGLKAYRPVAARNWLELNKTAGSGMGSMQGMPGMKDQKMKAMPGMKTMPGMDGMQGMGGGK